MRSSFDKHTSYTSKKPTLEKVKPCALLQSSCNSRPTYLTHTNSLQGKPSPQNSPGGEPGEVRNLPELTLPGLFHGATGVLSSQGAFLQHSSHTGITLRLLLACLFIFFKQEDKPSKDPHWAATTLEVKDTSYTPLLNQKATPYQAVLDLLLLSSRSACWCSLPHYQQRLLPNGNFVSTCERTWLELIICWLSGTWVVTAITSVKEQPGWGWGFPSEKWTKPFPKGEFLKRWNLSNTCQWTHCNQWFIITINNHISHSTMYMLTKPGELV